MKALISINHLISSNTFKRDMKRRKKALLLLIELLIIILKLIQLTEVLKQIVTIDGVILRILIAQDVVNLNKRMQI